MHLLLHTTPALSKLEKSSFKTVFCFFSKRFHILIVLSEEQETISLLSLVTVTASTIFVCPSKTASLDDDSEIFHIIIL